VNGGSSRADLRGFRWQLAPVEIKLNASVDAARMALALLRQQETGLQQGIATLKTQLDEGFAEVSAPAGAALHPWARASTLRYLVQQGQKLRAREVEAEALRLEVARARRDCASLRRQLACVEKLRSAAQAAFASEQMRAVAKEADLAWLAATARSIPPMTRDGAA
jgi:hypothetical protein